MKSVKDFLNEAIIQEKQPLIDVPVVDDTKRNQLAKAENEADEYETLCKKIDKNNKKTDELYFDFYRTREIARSFKTEEEKVVKVLVTVERIM